MSNKDHVVIINGSPRKNNNCSKIVETIVNKFEKNNIKYKILDVYKMNIDYCTACDYCTKTGKCRINDDMTLVYEEFDNSKGTIVVSPMYFSSVSTKTKTLVDRTQAFFSSKYVLKKPSIDTKKERRGLFIAIGGQPKFENQFLGGQLVMDIFFKCINTKLIKNMYMSNSDEVNYESNDEFKNEISKSIDEFIKEINSI